LAALLEDVSPQETKIEAADSPEKRLFVANGEGGQPKKRISSATFRDDRASERIARRRKQADDVVRRPSPALWAKAAKA
jgi:hypothetical protein